MLFSVARALLTRPSYDHVKKLTFTNCAKTLQVVVREKQLDNADAKIQILEEAIQLYRNRNKIFHNPLIATIGNDGDRTTMSHGLLNTKTGKPIDGFDLRKINDYAVKANLLSGELVKICIDV